MEPEHLLVVAAAIQALMAGLLWWQGKSLAGAATAQAEAATGTFLMNRAALAMASAEAIRRRLEELDLVRDAIRLEQAVSALLRAIKHGDDEALIELNRLSDAILVAFGTIREHEQATRASARPTGL